MEYLTSLTFLSVLLAVSATGAEKPAPVFSAKPVAKREGD